MTAGLSDVTLTDVELLALASPLGIHEFPTVLDVRPRHTSIDGRDAVYARASRNLLSRGLIGDDGVYDELAPMLRALQRPDRELAMRMVTPEGSARVTVVRRGSLGVRARRIGRDISLRMLRCDDDLHPMASALLAELPAAPPADIKTVGAPLHEMTECLSGTHDPLILADRIQVLGAESHAALLLGAALASRQAFAEIVHYILGDEDRMARSAAAVAVFYTKRGRIVAAPSMSPSAQLWTTLKAGSDRAVTGAISQLADLGSDTWGGDRPA